MLQPQQISELRRELLNRFSSLKDQARQAYQYLEANNLREYENKDDIVAAWARIKELFPPDFVAERVHDLDRHLHFAQPHDFIDIAEVDIPAVENSIRRYGRSGEAFIAEELQRLQSDLTAWQLLHPLIRDVAQDQFDAGNHRESVRLAIEFLMDKLRSLANRQDDGDQLIRQTIRVQSRCVSFSNCSNDNEKSVTEGLKQILQGLYKGVRNPTHHGWDGYSRTECFQILTTCSLICGRLQLVP